MRTTVETTIFAADLFCGAGGTSTGLLQAAKKLRRTIHLVAVNHWDIAIETHSKNHPGVNHYNSDLRDVDPRQVVPSGKLRLLVASPECTHFSKARGGKPRSKQSRASVKYVLKWINLLDEGPFFRSDAKSALFRNWLEQVNGYSEKLPDGSFKTSGTGVNTRLVVVG